LNTNKKLADLLLEEVKEALKNKVEDKNLMDVAEQVIGGKKVLVDQSTGEILDHVEEKEEA
jgi:hypothetical protein